MAEKIKKPTKAAVIQAVKAVATLVIICLVCVALLALLNDLLYVAPPSADSVYGELHTHADGTPFERDTAFDAEHTLTSDKKNEYGEVLSVVRDAVDGTFILEAISANKGYQGGTVTLYVVVSGKATIEKWAIKEYAASQTYIGNIPSSAGSTWYVGESVTAKIKFGPDDTTGEGVGKGTGATRSSEAINYAINAAAYYCRTALKGYLGLGEIKDPVKEAQNAVLALLTDSGYSYSSLSQLANVKSAIGTALNTGDDTLTYLFTGDGDQGKVYAYVYGEGEDIKIVVVANDGKLLADNLEDTDPLIDLILSKPIQEIAVTGSVKLYTFVSNVADNDVDGVEYVVTGLKLSSYDPDNYTLKVTVKDGVVTDIEITADGWADGYEEEAPHEKASKMAELLKGATLADIDSTYTSSSGAVAGTTQSANIITAAVKAALTHYDANYASKD